MVKEVKFELGQLVWLYNGLTGAIESDHVYGVLFVPRKEEGNVSAEDLLSGKFDVVVQYQTLQHSILNENVLFASEEDCRAFLRTF